jgi:hypothetical protein
MAVRAMADFVKQKPADNVEARKARSDMAGTGACHHVQHIEPAHIGEQSGALDSVVE